LVSGIGIQNDLIIDLGAHNGDDSAHYLEAGFRVVAVEANPLLAQSIQDRFAAEVSAGRLTVLNVGIAERTGTASFWVNDDNSVWSSFDRDLGGRQGSRCHAVPVQCMRLDTLLDAHGIPHYLKIDIEGGDRACLDSLQPTSCPKYLSCELTHGEGLIEKLYDLGYRRFKLINQSTFTDATPVFDHELGFRALRKLRLLLPATRRFFPDGLRSDLDSFSSRRGQRFPPGASGPFGEATFGPWHSREAVLRRYDEIRSRFLRAKVPLEQCWYDVHAS
jgi:FkbM family methyltransferase